MSATYILVITFKLSEFCLMNYGCYLETIFVHIWQIILATIWYSITSEIYAHTHVIRTTAQKTLGCSAIKFFVLLTSLTLTQVFVGSHHHINMRVWCPIFYVYSNPGWCVKVGIQVFRLNYVLKF